MSKTTSTLTLPTAGEDTPKHGFDAQITPDTHIRGGFKTVFGQGQTLDALGATIMHQVKKLESAENKAIQEQVLHTTQCCQHINAALKQGTFIQALREAVANDNANPSRRYAIGIQAMLSPIQAGQPAKLSAILKDISSQDNELSHRFLMMKVQPLLISHGLFIKNADNSYRWPTHKELCASLPVTPSNRIAKVKAKGQKAVTSLSSYVKTKAHDRKLAQAAKDPYQRITESGEIIQLRRAYKGELTNEEKAKIRDQHKAIEEAKIAKKTEIARSKTAASKERTEQRSAASQYQQINNQADLLIAEKQANRRVQQENLKSWIPVGIAASVAALVIISMNAGSSNDGLEVMTASWEQAPVELNESYPLPPETQENNQ